MKVPRRTLRKARIEMLPLIDIVFLLLVFFIYAMLSMSVHRAMPVQLPSSSAATVDKSTALVVTVKTDGSVYLNHQQVALDDLPVQLSRAAGTMTLPTVQLFAEDRLIYQNLFHVMDQIQAAGIHRIALQAEKEPES